MKVRANRLHPLVIAMATVIVAAGQGGVRNAQADMKGSDWTYCRGPHFDGSSSATGLIDRWDPRGGPGSNVAWRRDDLGGRSTPVAMDGRLYLILRSNPGTNIEGERVVCVDAKTGESLWEYAFNVYLSDVPDSRVGWSSVVCDPETSTVFALGVCGQFQCLDAKSGRLIWRAPLHERFGLLSTYGGRTNFPILCDDLVIVSGVTTGWGENALPAHRFIAFDKKTGAVAWLNGTRNRPYDTTYSIPTLAKVDGERMLIFGSGDGAVWAFQPRTGERIWRFPLSRRGINAPPLVDGDVVYAGHSEENVVGTKMGAVAAYRVGRARGDVPTENRLWMSPQLMAGKTAPLRVGERLWVFDDSAKLHVLNAQTGEAVSKTISLGTSLRANPLFADGKVYAFTTSGRWAILKPNDETGAEIVSRGRLRNEEVLASPICSQGRIFVPTTRALYCLFDAAKQPTHVARHSEVSSDKANQNSKPAHLQLTPADVILRPGETHRFSARLYDEHGRLLRVVQPEFELTGPGSISSKGLFTAPSSGHVATRLVASAEGVRGVARIRTIPPLPWRFDFEDVSIDSEKRFGLPPVTWIGARHRHVVRAADDGNVLVKITTIPKGTRSRSWMGASDLSNYTITADVLGREVDGKLPDIGLIGQGYTFDLQGAEQKAEIRTWVTQRRMARTVDFPWRPDTWYTLKLRTQVMPDGRARLQAKAWLREDREPTAWTVEAWDESPNRTGSPGLFGNANDAEILIDNIRVESNVATRKR